MTSAMNKKKEKSNSDCRFTVKKGIPGVRLQHICSMVRGAAAPLQILRMNVVWQTAVTGQGLRDVIHTVHLQAGLIFKNTCRCTERKRRVKGDIFKVALYVGTVTYGM